MKGKYNINFGKPVQIIKLIRTTLKIEGNGKDKPFRLMEQYWDFNGNLVFEEDSYHRNSRTIENYEE
jgi:hypothetical protein